MVYATHFRYFCLQIKQNFIHVLNMEQSCLCGDRLEKMIIFSQSRQEERKRMCYIPLVNLTAAFILHT